MFFKSRMEIMKKIIVFLAAMILGFSLYAQSAEVITQILDSDEISFGQICYLSAVSQGLISDDSSFDDAISALIKQGQIRESTNANDSAKLSDVASIYAKLFDLKGGLFYRITKASPRYALKHLKAEGIIPQVYDPSKIISGREALSLFTKCNMRYGENPFTDEL